MTSEQRPLGYFWFVFLGLLVHIVMAGVFLYVGNQTMIAYNCLSIAIFVWGLWYLRRNEWLVVLVCFAEPTVFCLISVLEFGWSYDFQNWLIAICVLALIVPFQERRPFYILAVVNAFTYLGLFLWWKIQAAGGQLAMRDALFAMTNVFSVFATIFFAEKLMHWSRLMELMALNQKIEKMEDIIDVDALTGVFTRRKMNEILEGMDRTMQAGDGSEFHIIFVDIDDFKKVNDTYGHDAGDKVLKAVAGILKRELRSSDVVARWGGEEFVVLMNSAGSQEKSDTRQVFNVLERVRKRIQSTAVLTGGADSLRISVTATFGGVGSRDFQNTTDMINAADVKMYQGKHSGKNCIMID